jgi:hypothetical protein
MKKTLLALSIALIAISLSSCNTTGALLESNAGLSPEGGIVFFPMLAAAITLDLAGNSLIAAAGRSDQIRINKNPVKWINEKKGPLKKGNKDHTAIFRYIYEQKENMNSDTYKAFKKHFTEHKHTALNKHIDHYYLNRYGDKYSNETHENKLIKTNPIPWIKERRGPLRKGGSNYLAIMHYIHEQKQDMDSDNYDALLKYFTAHNETYLIEHLQSNCRKRTVYTSQSSLNSSSE